MGYNIPPLARLAENFERIPGVGRKSAQRMAFYVLGLTEDAAKDFADSIVEAKQRIHCCSV